MNRTQQVIQALDALNMAKEIRHAAEDRRNEALREWVTACEDGQLAPVAVEGKAWIMINLWTKAEEEHDKADELVSDLVNELPINNQVAVAEFIKLTGHVWWVEDEPFAGPIA